MAKLTEAQARKRFETVQAKSKLLYKEQKRLKAEIDKQHKKIRQARIDLVMALSVGSIVHHWTYPLFGESRKLGGRTGTIYKKGSKYIYVDFGGDVGKWRIAPRDLADGPGKHDEVAETVAKDVGAIFSEVL